MSGSKHAVALMGLLLSGLVAAQAPPPGGPPPPPNTALGEPQAPSENPLTEAKIRLGGILFWDEQISLTQTVACGTCHRAFSGGGDPRPIVDADGNRNPGADGVFATADDVLGSAGVPAHEAQGLYLQDPTFGTANQVGGRNSPSAVNAGFTETLFWDGRAGSTLLDPNGGATLIADGAALENQALGPIVNSAEMARLGGTLADIEARIAAVTPLALATDVPADWQSFIAGRDYAALFNEAFGSSDITAARFAMAVASYERTLNANQTPFDAEASGTPSLTTQERAGRQVFDQAGCRRCHGGALFSDDNFHYIGVRAQNADPGRFAVTGNNAHRGAMRTPGLRNVELSAPYMADGRFATLEEVVEFYDRGADFTAPNLAPQIDPLNLSTQQKANLVAFLKRPLTDPRSAAESGPFARPTLFTESTNVPVEVAPGQAGPLSALAPTLRAQEPAIASGREFTIALEGARPGATAWAVVDSSDPSSLVAPEGNSLFGDQTFSIDSNGIGSINLALGGHQNQLGIDLYLRVYVEEQPELGNAGYALSPAVRFRLLDVPLPPVFRGGFE
ncbi:cytochrome-c peroxidase [Pseudomarimonas arenosa]|uniref:Cytochrome c domain-containing protein n=1 Tax=Pseudomarimonas arenosa TaxID=2774145 RepID=A0AAW3ZGA0_9GAMM|nr:cytochrome c peroxidase [Pseudomarimonas arenosa]MBD8524599.1 hypothetical protein [Pseudomarimonas arenosa]